MHTTHFLFDFVKYRLIDAVGRLMNPQRYPYLNLWNLKSQLVELSQQDPCSQENPAKWRREAGKESQVKRRENRSRIRERVHVSVWL